MLTIPSPGRAPSHGALDSGPGPLGDTMTSSRGGSSSRPRIATLSRVTRRASVERLVQATTVRSAAPLTFASGSESCPRPLGPKFVGFAPQVFRVRASDHLSSPSDDSRFPRANGGERRAANTTRTAACAMQPATTRTAASATQPAQRERRRAPSQPVQRERRRAQRSHATRTAACATQPATTRTAACATLPTQRERQRVLRWPHNGCVVQRDLKSPICDLGYLRVIGTRTRCVGE
ncbi:hypothetical protein BC826DRAFT_232172 [Russula brevipes]|nr:hypothetical protein BC826DRAFT_232172 [Russula brevipes]